MGSPGGGLDASGYVEHSCEEGCSGRNWIAREWPKLSIAVASPPEQLSRLPTKMLALTNGRL